MWKKKIYKFSLTKFAYRLNKQYNIIFGNYAVKSLNIGLITQKHLENLRRKLSKQFKKLNTINKSKIYIRVLLWLPFTVKPMLSRMGKGAGVITSWKALIKPGFILLEILSIESFFSVNKIVIKAISSFPLKLILLQK